MAFDTSTDNPSYAGGYGYAPYQEAARKAQMRLGLQDRLLAALSGLGSIRPGAGFGESFLGALGGSARATWAAKQAAMNYAQRQADQAQRDADRNATIEDRNLRTKTYVDNSKAYADHLLKLEQNQSVKYGPLPWYLRPEWKDTPEGKAAQGKATHIAQGKGPAAAKPPKPMKFPRRVPVGKDKPTEQQIIDSIMEETDPGALSPYVTGRGSADSEAIRRAAQIRTGQIMREGR